MMSITYAELAAADMSLPRQVLRGIYRGFGGNVYRAPSQLR